MPNDTLFPIDLWLPLREAWVAHLKAFGPLTALVSAGRIYGEQPKDAVPQWPFIRIGPQITLPYIASGQVGSAHRLTTHCFARGPYTDAVQAIAAQVVASANEFSSPEFDITAFDWVGTNTVADAAEAGKFHAIVDFDITTILLA